MDASEITILFVDDDEIIRDTMGAFLEDEGFSVFYAESGEKALEDIMAIRPTVCISDMRLSGMSGDIFIGKAHAICPETSYLLHTGMNYFPSDELLAIGITQADVIQKPVRVFSTFIDRIIKVASSREATE